MKRNAIENDRLPVFTERFRKLQGEKTNTEFADFLGISRQTVGFYCNGDRIPDAYMLRCIAEKCNVSSDWLLGLSNAKPRDESVQVVCNYSGLSEIAAVQLNEYKIHESGKIVISVIDEILNRDNPYSCNFHAFITKYILSSVALKQNLQESNHSSYAEEIERISSESFQRLLNGSASIEISVATAKHIYKDSALHALQQIFEIAADKSIKNIEEKRKSK